jgi:hypothetical protein
LRGSAPDEHTLPTLVKEGATIGARAVIGNDLSIGRFAMVGMGSVVTRAVPDFALVVGHPARIIGFVCRCGEPLVRFPPGEPARDGDHTCGACNLAYRVRGGSVKEMALAG